ncbi:MAG: TonB family protein [Archangium sp.]
MKRWPPWAIALVVTVSVHAVIVGWLVWRDAPPPIAPVTVQLKDAKALTRVAVLNRAKSAGAPAPQQAAPTAAPSEKPRAATTPAAPSSAEPSTASAAVPEVMLPAGDDGAGEGQGDAPAAPSSAAEGDGSAGQGGAAPAPAAPTPDFDALVHGRLVNAAAQCYPAAARRFKQQGTVELSFCADASGALNQGSVKKSSGSELLDRAATECVLARASPFPSGAEGRCYSLPVRFGGP